MSEEGKLDESIRIAHLTMIQGVISRMGANCFALKALAAAFGSATVAVLTSSTSPSPIYAIAACVPIVIFWLMDAQYLKQERAYRKFYDHVRAGKEVDLYSLDVRHLLAEPPSTLRVAVTWSVLWFYGAIVLSLAGVGLAVFGAL